MYMKIRRRVSGPDAFNKLMPMDAPDKIRTYRFAERRFARRWRGWRYFAAPRPVTRLKKILAWMSHRGILDRHDVGTYRKEPIMTAKINLFAAAPSLMKDLQRTSIALEAAANFDPAITELVKLRASQINGCANCLNMHAAEAREKGETEQRIYLLPAWREAPCFSGRERAALAWTDALTRLSEGRDRTQAYEALKTHFTEEEQVKLTVTINIINGWNRLAVGFHQFADAAEIKAAARMAAA
jgi:AhpD family alkylhydroperoxidase